MQFLCSTRQWTSIVKDTRMWRLHLLSFQQQTTDKSGDKEMSKQDKSKINKYFKINSHINHKFSMKIRLL